MRKILMYFIAASFALNACTNKKNSLNMENPLLKTFDAPFEAPPFENIKPEHYFPALMEGMKQQKEAILAIIENPNEPDFSNTIVAIENSGELLEKVSDIFYNITEAETNDELKAISKDLAPLMATHSDDIKLNIQLFAKVKMVYDKKDSLNLSIEEQTLLDNIYKTFVRGGANLDSISKERFREINKELSLLYLTFGDNVLAENNRYMLVIDQKDDLAGLSENSIAAAAELAIEKGMSGKWIFTIQKPSLLPFLENAQNRSLRESIYKAYISKANNNDSLDNKKIVNTIVNLRIERAQLLGFKNHADFILERNMAKNAENVYQLLNNLMPAALNVAKNEVVEMQKIVTNEGGNFKLQAWDYPYYAAKVKELKFALNENEIRPYLKLENVRDGMFWVANQLYGITFTKLENMPVYHSQVEVFEAKEANGDHIGILYMDYHPRESKRSGAWCTSFKNQKYKNGKRVAPIVSIVCNFSSPTGDTPALLTVDETETLFHEFGHALDGLLANKHFGSLNTPRDFVELPSQIMENWAFAPEVLNHYAKHYITNEPMPEALIQKIEKAGKFNQGFATTEYLAAAYLDMDYHTLNTKTDIEINDFEKQSMARINLIPEIDPRYRSTYYQHIFTGNSYSAGYYSYIWAEVLDADAFEAFKLHGLFDSATASAFRKNILELGGTEDAMELYRKFRGTDPNINALLEKRGLTQD